MVARDQDRPWVVGAASGWGCPCQGLLGLGLPVAWERIQGHCGLDVYPGQRLTAGRVFSAGTRPLRRRAGCLFAGTRPLIGYSVLMQTLSSLVDLFNTIIMFHSRRFGLLCNKNKVVMITHRPIFL